MRGYYETGHITKFVWLVTLFSSMGMFMDGYVLTIFSATTALPTGLKYVFKPTSLEWGLMGAAPLIGMLLGAATFGNIADRIGRRKMYIYDLSATALFLLLTAFSTNWLEFFLLQLGAGVGIGADYPISSSIQAEFSPTKRRGMLLVLNIFMWTIGSIVFLLVSIPLYFVGNVAWKLMYGTAAIIPLIVVAARNTIPESPWWLKLKEKKKEFEKSVSIIAASVGVLPSRLAESIKLEKGKSSSMVCL
ncbi:MAG: MFS transporter [Candidatus Micrarchaeia archaeon]